MLYLEWCITMSRFANYNISLYNTINCVEMLPVDIFRKEKLSNTQSENILNQSLSLFSEKIHLNHQSITRRAPNEPWRNSWSPQTLCSHGFGHSNSNSIGFHRSMWWFGSKVSPTTITTKIYARYMPDICHGQVTYGYNWCIYIKYILI